MASRGNRGGGGDRVLESRHVIGLFLLMLVFSGVFFALGYVMGRNQYDGQVRAESTPRATPDPVTSARADLPSHRTRNSASNSASSAISANPASSANSSANSANAGWGAVSSSPSAATSSRDSAAAPSATPDETAAPSSDWSFYNSGKNPPDDRLKPAPATPSASGSASVSPLPNYAVPPGKNAKPANPSSKTPVAVPATAPFPAGTYVLQVAAMRQSVDASAVATSLRAKHFPAIVVNPTTDKYYHVQVGPYHDVKSADAAKKGLESAGFKAIVKH
jgi:cell division septation protein DedD